ncbi:hypothetical protein ACHAXS_011903 [Conticribra weissflogii]
MEDMNASSEFTANVQQRDAANRTKRQMKSKTQSSRKKSRGGIGCLVGDGAVDIDDSENAIGIGSPSEMLRVEVVPLSRAFEIISETTQSKGSAATMMLRPNGDEIVESCDAYSQKSSQLPRLRHDHRRRVRIIRPYPFTFSTFAKSRWIGRTVVDVYHEEFGSYPRSYYEAAVQAGRILVSGKRVASNYKIKGGDELTHTVHRHEPAVGLDNSASLSSSSTEQSGREISPIHIIHECETLLVVDKPSTLPIHPCGGYNYNSMFEILRHWKPDLYGSGKLFTIHRLDRLTSGIVMIAKNAKLASSLGKCIMDRDGCEKIYLARVMGKFPLNLYESDNQRDSTESGDDSRGRSCHHHRVHHPWRFYYDRQNSGNRQSQGHDIEPPCQYGEFSARASRSRWKGGLKITIPNSNEGKKKKGKTIDPIFASEESTSIDAALGYWITNQHGKMNETWTLQNIFDQSSELTADEILEFATGSKTESGQENDADVSATVATTATPTIHWLNFACPCRVASHKNGICEAGDFSQFIMTKKDENDNPVTNRSDDNKSPDNDQGSHVQIRGIKPAQTSFTLVSYDASSNTSLVLAKPVTGRTHQIRLHLQALGHPIANDHCYGGELWFGDEEGKELCKKTREFLDILDSGDGADADNGENSANTCGSSSRRITPENSTTSDVPATEAEIYHAAANRPREDGESILEFIEKTCVWCARCRGVANMGHWDRKNDGVDNETLRMQQEAYVFRRVLMEFLVRSQGIWLHALQYSLKTKDRKMKYRTQLPRWAKFQ